jgi:hypothetical protein
LNKPQVQRLWPAFTKTTFRVCCQPLLAPHAVYAPTEEMMRYPRDAELSKAANVNSGGMTDQANTAFSVYFILDMDEYDKEHGMSNAMGLMWDKTLVAPQDCPVSDNPSFVLYADGGVRAVHAIDMNP